MSSWYSLNLGDGIMAATPTDELKERFLRSFAEAGSPPEMAVFTRAESEGHLHCEIIAYFSPATAQIAEEYDADICEKPSRSGLGLLAGDTQAWSILFPESHA